MSLLELLSWMAAALAGAVGHEVAHYLVWTATGRDPKLHLLGLYVEPRAGPSAGTFGDRVAAAAPYLVGLTALLWAFASSGVVWAVFGVAMVQLPSAADIAAVRGEVEWASLAE